ncbi:MAG TPA: methylmalonyl Co-A mutase-associated GTPase MeaB, partial [Actinoplanes sp.]|nr:methylmalonyl Co-A mutase-associated GTPase MeaB [Actinoplanes sp.]
AAAKSEGIDDVLGAVGRHRDWLVESGTLGRRREARAAAEIEAIALGELRARLVHLHAGTALAAEVATGRLDPFAAARMLLDGPPPAG